jgi:hypothetical protein
MSMRKPHLCALLSFVSIAALQTWPAAAASPGGDRQLSQERWMLRQDLSEARTRPRSEIRVHFFNPNQVFRASQTARTPRIPIAAPILRPAPAISRPVAARPPVIIAAAHSAPRLIASHGAGGGSGALLQPEVRSGR